MTRIHTGLGGRFGAPAAFATAIVAALLGLLWAVNAPAQHPVLELLRPSLLIVSGGLAAIVRARGRRLPWVVLAILGVLEMMAAVAEQSVGAAVTIVAHTKVSAVALSLAPLLLFVIAVSSLVKVRRYEWIALVDALAIGAALFAAVWTNHWMDRIFGVQVSMLMKSLNLTAFFLDGMIGVLLFGFLIRARGVPSRQGMPVLLVVALLASIGTDATGALLSTTMSDVWGQLPWTMKIITAAAAPWVGPVLADHRARAHGRIDLSTVTVVVFVATIPLVLYGLSSGIDGLSMVTVGSGTMLLVVRLWLANWDNAQLAKRLVVSERAYRRLAQQTHGVVIRVDNNGRVMASDQGERSDDGDPSDGGASPTDPATLRPVSESMSGSDWTELLLAEDREAALAWWDAQATSTLHVRVLNDGVPRWAALVQSPTAHGLRLIGFRDIDDEVKHLLALESESTTDSLTGLPNRRALQALLDARIEEAMDNLTGTAAQVHERTRFGVLYCDLDGFKNVNDGHGHEVGDVVLSVAAQRILAAVGMAGVATRFGGDEFVVVTDHESDSRWQAVAAELAAAILAEVDRPFDDVHHRVSVSIGIADWEAGMTSAEVLQRADVAMYRAKLGKGAIAFYDQSLDDRRAPTAAVRLAETT